MCSYNVIEQESVLDNARRLRAKSRCFISEVAVVKAGAITINTLRSQHTRKLFIGQRFVTSLGIEAANNVHRYLLGLDNVLVPTINKHDAFVDEVDLTRG